MSKLFWDCHCHTERSACAEDVSLEAYRQRALDNANYVFAITDHSAHLFYPPDNRWGFWTDQATEIFEACYDEGIQRCRDYVNWVRASQVNGMLVGVELDCFEDGRLAFDPDLLSSLDIIVGAVHGHRALKRGAPWEEVVAEFQTRVLRLFEAGAQVIAHPFREFAQNKRDVPDSLIQWLVNAAADAGAALELNCHYQVHDADVRMVLRCLACGVPIAIGTDTHRAREFADFSYHVDVLREVGLTPDTWEQYLMAAPTSKGIQRVAAEG